MVVRWRECVAQVADWFYPRVCPGCGAISDRPGYHLCAACFARIELHDQSLCGTCGAPAEGGVAHAFVCGACQEARPAFDRARSAGHFHGVLREQVHQFKYGSALWLRHDLADLLLGCLAAHFVPGEVDVVVPVPLHPARERERSYNQSALLAQEVARRLDRRFDRRSLERVRRTQSQTQFDAAHRRMNILGAFAVRRPEWVAQRCVLLVDDVMTTGATLAECARVLKKAGARKVWAVTAARG
jgi:ComF family protein